MLQLEDNENTTMWHKCVFKERATFLSQNTDKLMSHFLGSLLLSSREPYTHTVKPCNTALVLQTTLWCLANGYWVQSCPSRCTGQMQLCPVFENIIGRNDLTHIINSKCPRNGRICFCCFCLLLNQYAIYSFSKHTGEDTPSNSLLHESNLYKSTSMWATASCSMSVTMSLTAVWSSMQSAGRMRFFKFLYLICTALNRQWVKGSCNLLLILFHSLRNSKRIQGESFITSL